MRPISTYIVDTNILLRYLMNDHPQQSEAAKKLIEKTKNGLVKLQIPFVTITETAFTLRTRYNVDRPNIAEALLTILCSNRIEVNAPSWIFTALVEYKNRNISFGDACIAAEARFSKLPVASFDGDFDKFEGVKRVEPK